MATSVVIGAPDNLLKKLAFQLLYWTGVVRLAAWLNRRRVVVLCYHGVTNRSVRHPDDPFGLHVREDRFRAHLDYLKRHYQVISFRDYLRARREGLDIPNYSTVITFDDGHRNFYTAAAPLLDRYNMRAVMFLISDRIVDDGAGPQKWHESDDQKYLSWSEVHELMKDGFEFGSHTCSHQKLPQLAPRDVEHELRDSKTVIEQQLTRNNLPLAYPYGMTTDGIASLAASLGYSCAFTTATGFNDQSTHLFKLHRTLIGDDDNVAAFAARAAGLTGWLQTGD
ncbi:MAG TPA: polysaccharide deacetylase family protein [Pyrinomonadaceae bacterium]|jgi:peptidoglycan/xylan/chitin deacetylase (PgdA/CDA1 family)